MSIKSGLRKQNEKISHRVGENIKKAKTYYPEFMEFLQVNKKRPITQ